MAVRESQERMKKQNEQSKQTRFAAWREKDIKATIAANEDEEHQQVTKGRTTEEEKKETHE